MKKLIALLTLMMFAVSLFAMPTVSLAAGTKSANYNLFTTTGARWNGTDVRGNNGNLNDAKNHGNQAAGSVNYVWYDLLNMDSSRTEETRDAVPKYNKIVFQVNSWNTETLTVYHGTTKGSTEEKNNDISGRGWTEVRNINSHGKSGDACKANLYQAFSFDATTNQYVGYQNKALVDYKYGGASSYNFYLKEIEVYYVTPDSAKITTDDAVFVNAGDTFTATVDVLDVDGDVINDSELNGITWTIEGTNATIDSATGLVTVGNEFSANEKITLTATSTYDSSIVASKAITLVNKAVEDADKSENFALNMPATSAWSGIAGNMVDGDFTTSAHGGRHSAGNWRTVVDMSSHDFVRYNKVVVTYRQYNTEYITIRSGSDSNVSDGLNVTKNLNLDHKSTESLRQVISFDKATDPFIQLDNKYLHATSGTAADNEYYDKNPTIYEFEVYYVKPVAIEVDVNEAYTVTPGSTIIPVAKVLDIDGDEILDTELNGITWSVSGSNDVSINSVTGAVTVNNAITADQVITVTATGYNGLTTSKNIRLTTSTIGKITFDNLPDFVMTNATQAGSATFIPEVTLYGHDGAEIEAANVEWSIEGDAEGVELIDSATGAFVVDSTAPVGEFTLVCTPTAAGENLVASKTIKINNPVNLALGSSAWGMQSWGGASAYRAFDGNPDTYHSHGVHNGGRGVAVVDFGKEINANYIVTRFTNINNSQCYRVSVANELTLDATDANKKEFVAADMPSLVPFKGHIANMGTTVWSARSDNDDIISSDLEQEHVLTQNDMYSYLDTDIKGMRYMAFANQAIGSTADYGVFGIYELELYNTAPNYVKINLPEDIDISSTDAEVTLTADMYNGLAKEAEAVTCTWSAQSFSITEDGVLTVPSTDEYVLGTITCTYTDESGFSSNATIYVCTSEGKLSFSDSAEEFIDCVFLNGLVEKDGTIYAPSDMDVSEIYESIISNSDVTYDVLIADSDFELIEEGEIVDGYTVYVGYGDYLVSYALTTKSSLDVNVSSENGTYTAICSLKADVENATLIIAEYSGNKLVNLDFDAKDSAIDELGASISGVADGNTVKTMLVESIASMKPLK